MRRFTRDEAHAFVRANTARVTTPLLPEIALHLATEITPLWEAIEASLEASGLAPPYWAFAWVGGQALARFILDDPALVRGRRVLDFAAGSGVAGIAAMRAGASTVDATELDALATAAIELNACANAVEIELLIEDVTSADPPQANRGWDVVLAGDVCYERPMAERATRWLRQLAREGVAVFLADPGRAYLPKEGLVELRRYSVPTTRELEDRASRDVMIYRLSGTE
ncbi:MAG TPA: 50S ribosomal protein L11 methyltransferase [Alphaproteobacteria bacterium]